MRPTEIRLIYNYGQKYIIDKNASKYLPKFSLTRAKNISILKRNAYTKVIIDKSSAEVSLLEQDTIENVS